MCTEKPNRLYSLRNYGFGEELQAGNREKRILTEEVDEEREKESARSYLNHINSKKKKLFGYLI